MGSLFLLCPDFEKHQTAHDKQKQTDSKNHFGIHPQHLPSEILVYQLVIQYRGECERGQKANITVPTGLPAVSGTLGNAATPSSHTPLFFLSERNPGYTAAAFRHES